MRLFWCMVLSAGVVWFGWTGAAGRAADEGEKPPPPKPSVRDKNGKINGKTIKEWVQQLQDKDSKARYAAVEALAKAGPLALEAVPALEKMKASSDDYDRKLAEYALAYVKPPATKQEPQALMAVLRSRKSTDAERNLAACQLANLGPKARPFFDDLVGLLKDENPYTRSLAAYALPYLKPDSDDAAVPLSEAMKDSNKEVARNAAAGLVVMGGNAKKVTPTLVQLLNDKDPYMRALALYVLGEIKPYPDDVVKPITKALRDTEESVRNAAKAALKKVDKAEAKRQGID